MVYTHAKSFMSTGVMWSRDYSKVYYWATYILWYFCLFCISRYQESIWCVSSL